MTTPRATMWNGLPVETHLRLVDVDLDELERDSRSDRAALRAEMKEGFARCEADSENLRRLLVGLLIAMVTTSITIVATVLIAGGGS